MGTLPGSHAQRRFRRGPLSLARDRCRNVRHPRPPRRTRDAPAVALFSEPFLLPPSALVFLGFPPPVRHYACPRRSGTRHSCTPPRFGSLVQFFLPPFHPVTPPHH